MLWPLEGESNDHLKRNSERIQQEREALTVAVWVASPPRRENPEHRVPSNRFQSMFRALEMHLDDAVNGHHLDIHQGRPAN